jgi:hypothetical protein
MFFYKPKCLRAYPHAGKGAKNNAGDPSITYRFVTALVKGEPNQWAIRGGNAATGALSTFYSGARPSGYNPMHKEGAIILGTGGDNSITAAGTFYEPPKTRCRRTSSPPDIRHLRAAAEALAAAEAVAAEQAQTVRPSTLNVEVCVWNVVTFRVRS